MTKSNHSAGPWNCNAGTRNKVMAVYSRNIGSVCEMTKNMALTTEQQNAPAALIAAAPELLEALEAAIVQIKSSKEFNAPIKQSFSVRNLVENQLLKAIAKARGEA